VHKAMMRLGKMKSPTLRYEESRGCCHDSHPVVLARGVGEMGLVGKNNHISPLDFPNKTGHYKRAEKALRNILSLVAEDRQHMGKKGRERGWEDHHATFTVLRDPVDRFVSAVGQVLGMKRSARNVGRKFQQQCRAIERMFHPLAAEDGGDDIDAPLRREILRCALSYLREHDHGPDVDVHFTPASTRLAFNVMGMDVKVAVFPMDETQSILQALGQSQGNITNARVDKGEKWDHLSPMLRRALKGLSTKDLDGTMTQAICEMYQVDVMLYQHLGLKVPLCEYEAE